MKHNKRSLTSFIVLLLLVNLFTCTKLNLKSQSLSLSKSQDAQPTDIEKAWGLLFNGVRDSGCSANKNIKPDILPGQKDPTAQGNGDATPAATSGWGFTRPSFNWIKKWGFGPVAYLIDYLDPVFLDDFLIEVKQIMSDFNKISKEDNDDSKDPFKLSFIAPKNNPLLTDNDFKDLNPKFSKAIYDTAINAVQLRKALEDWSWASTDGTDQAFDFVVKYDINGDGRLDVHELMLGNIWNNKKRDDLICYNCFFLLARKLGALFQFMDCQNKGYLEAEELWKKLPLLKRKVGLWNIFLKTNIDTIRTNAVNDFILKNSYTIDGAVSKSEFVTGMLLAFWQRQTTHKGLVTDDQISIKKHRWNQGREDIVASKLDS